MTDDQGEAEWPVHDSTVAWETEYFDAGYDRVERPGGERANYYWLSPGDSVSIVAVHEGEVVMVEQYRPRQRERFRSCPVGGVDPGESFEEAGRRELREETGYRADDVELLQRYYSEGWLRKERGVVFADGLTPGEQDTDEGEFVDVVTVPVDEAIETARGEPANGWTLTPLLLAREEGLL